MAVKAGKTSKKTLAEREAFNRQVCDFIDASPTPFHAASSLRQLLLEVGFIELDESESWQLQAGQNYFVLRNQSSLIAWCQGELPVSSHGWRMLGAHTDSPCLRVKPRPDLYQQHSWRLGVEVYGGALLNPWFDRDLSLAGRVHFLNDHGAIEMALVDFICPVATIPSLAIHLDRKANENRSVNAQRHLPVLLAGSARAEYGTLDALLLDQLKAQQCGAKKILDHELSFYDTQKAALIGVEGDFIAASRLDNLLSCYVDVRALIDASATNAAPWSLLICSDHEEVGSASASGAAGPFLLQVLQRIESDPAAFAQAVAHSMLISTDNAHALHPNYADKADANHAPKVNGGPVIKVNANQRYASNSETQAIFRALCDTNNVPVQDFVMRSDMACGSTIGPITATELGIKTLDVGMPTFAMHSIRELAGSHDPLMLHKVLQSFLQRQH